MDEEIHYFFVSSRHMPRYINLSRFILLLLLIVEVEAFGRPRSHKHKRKSSVTVKDCYSRSTMEKPLTEKSKESTIIDYDPYYNCGLVGFGVVQKILYPGSTSGYSTMIDVNFSSACVRCGMCLAIAEKINQTLIDVHDSMPSNKWLEDDEAILVLGAVCDDEFKHYALREIDGERYIGDSLPEAILVATTADGSWEKTLRNRCHNILDEVGTRNLYKHWRDWCDGPTKDLADFLCRSDSGGLRDCRSIDGDGIKPEICTNSCGAGIKVMAEFG